MESLRSNGRFAGTLSKFTSAGRPKITRTIGSSFHDKKKYKKKSKK
jgi:hypothetical protein